MQREFKDPPDLRLTLNSPFSFHGNRCIVCERPAAQWCISDGRCKAAWYCAFPDECRKKDILHYQFTCYYERTEAVLFLPGGYGSGWPRLVTVLFDRTQPTVPIVEDLPTIQGCEITNHSIRPRALSQPTTLDYLQVFYYHPSPSLEENTGVKNYFGHRKIRWYGPILIVNSRKLDGRLTHADMTTDYLQTKAARTWFSNHNNKPDLLLTKFHGNDPPNSRLDLSPIINCSISLD